MLEWGLNGMFWGCCFFYCIFEKLTSYLGYKTPLYSSKPQHILKCNRKFNQIAIVGMRTFLCSRLAFFFLFFFKLTVTTMNISAQLLSRDKWCL